MAAAKQPDPKPDIKQPAPTPVADSKDAPPKDQTYAALGVIALMMCVAMGVLGIQVHALGWDVLRDAESKELWIDDVTVDAMIANHTFLHVGGPHSGGTTVLWHALRTHPAISGFGDKTGADLSEGIFLQRV